jgi:hypothetical protein
MNRRRPRSRRSMERRAKVLQELDQVIAGGERAINPIEEQLHQCPEAFQVGKVVEQLCQQLKHEHHGGDRVLPQAGVIFPPFV